MGNEMIEAINGLHDAFVVEKIRLEILKANIEVKNIFCANNVFKNDPPKEIDSIPVFVDKYLPSKEVILTKELMK